MCAKKVPDKRRVAPRRYGLVETLPRRPHPQEAVRTALSTIGRLGPYAVQPELTKAQGLLYEAERQELDPQRIQVAASLIRQVAVSLMKVAAGLDRALDDTEEQMSAPNNSVERTHGE